MADTIETLKQLAQQVRNATAEGENTAERVGRTLVGIIEHLGDGGDITQDELKEMLKDYPTKQDVEVAMANYVTTAFFARIFGIDGEDGAQVDINDTEAVITAIKVKFGLYSESFVSAKGKNPDAGSTPGGSTTLAGLTDVSITGTPGDGQVLAFDATLNKWTPVDMEATAGIDEEELLQILTQKGYATQTWVTQKGYATQTWVTQKGYATQTWVTQKGYATQTWVTQKGYATQQWVTQQSYAKTSVRIKAGTGLTGGGTLAQDVTLSLATVGTAGTYTKVTVDSYGRVTGHSTLTQGDIPALAISKITGLQTTLDAKLNKSVFEELFEKVWVSGYGYAIRAKLALYTDSWMSAKGSNPDAGSTVTGGIDEEELAEYLKTHGYATQSWASGQFALKTVAINAGTGLTGGGNLSANRTLSLATVGTAGTYTKVTVDAYGRVTGHASLVDTDIPNLPWSKIMSGKPTTLAGYGITDAYTKTEADGRFFRRRLNWIDDTTTDSDDLWRNGIYLNATGNAGTNSTFPSTFGILLNFAYYDNNFRLQLHATGNDIRYNYKFDSTRVSDWKVLLNSTNYNNYTVTKTGGGASGTWGINISGNAATAGDADTLDGTHKSGLLTALTSSSGTNLSLTVGGTTKTVSDLYATYADQLRTSRTLWGQPFNGTANVSGDMTGVGILYFSNGGNIRNNSSDVFSMYTGVEAAGLKAKFLLASASYATDVAEGCVKASVGVIADSYLQVGSARLKYDSSTGALYVEKSDGTQCGFYATGFVSAKGANADAGSVVAGVTELSELDDVAISSPVNGQALVYRNGVWKNETVSGGGGTASVAWDDITGKPTWIPDTDGSGSGIDADLLDGTHKSGLFTAMTYLGSTLSLTIGGVRKSVNIETSAVIPTVSVSSTSSRNLSVTVGGVTDYVNDLYATYSTYADYLRTSRMIWGQSFNGGSSISGDMTGVGILYFSNNVNIRAINSSTAGIYASNDAGGLKVKSLYIGTSYSGSAEDGLLAVNNNGNAVTIGSQNSSFCHIYNSKSIPFIFNNTVATTAGDLGTSTYRWGTVYAKNALNASSDLRLKQVLEDIPLTIAAVAAAPSFFYRWKSGKDAAIHAGSAAQYWQKALPQAVLKGEDGYLSMEYDRIALAAVITTARTVVDHEQRIRRLEDALKVAV